MRIDVPIAIAGARVWRPPTVGRSENASSRGVLSGPEVAGVGSSTASGDLTGPEMAVYAAVGALADARRSPAEVDGLAYGWVSHQGEHVWTPPHRVARLLGANRCVALGVQQMANSGVAALRESVLWLVTEPDWTTTVAATGDGLRPHDPCQGHSPPAGGGTAIVVTRGPGRRTIASIVSVAAPCPESSHLDRDSVMTLREGRQDSAARPEATREVRAAVCSAVAQALGEASLTDRDPRLSAVLVPGAGDSALRGMVCSGLLDGLRDRVRSTRASAGYLGAGGLLADLAEEPPPGPGEHHLLVSVAAGGTVAAVVVSGH
ncbi:hypothetical protein NE235_22470 [Actinoallomurus spadix]|uniref:Beta-ketoacyl synthase N-terminal domain-containing protein n=1 Tax=Actinoallomurus spadix TaxID=79912 RepID=A0ABN0XFC9_9ACTN|nr:hypothetical protein [Actinoallomurus spadix]MCO5988874.1 hypothetical protein [Actinoallomurus spadix]